MKITVINQFFLPDVSPTARLAGDLAAHRTRCGDQVTVIAARANYADSDVLCNKETVARVKVLRGWTPRFRQRNVLTKCIEAACFYVHTACHVCMLPPQDVIVSLTTPPWIGWIALLHKLRHRSARFLLWNMDCYPEVMERSEILSSRGLASRLFRAVTRLLLHQCDYVICLDQAMRQLIDSSYFDRKGKDRLPVISNWPPPPKHPTAQEATLSLPNGQWLSKKVTVVLYSGNMGRGHAFGTVLCAAQRLLGESFHFIFCGGGYYAPHLGRAIEQQRLSNCQRIDYLPEKTYQKLLNRADCVLVTLRDEMLGVMSPSKVYAALAAEKPIAYVGPADSNVDEVIQQFGSGRRFDHHDACGLADFLRKLRRHAATRRRLSNGARSAYKMTYNADYGLSQFDQLLEPKGNFFPAPYRSESTQRAA